MKTKHCPLCDKDLPRNVFTSTRAKYCNPCKRIRQLKQAKERQQRQIDKLKTKHTKTKAKKKQLRISDLKKKAQRIFNKWIRERDKDLPCISCNGNCGKWDAGHFWAMGSNGALRYHEDNCHKQGVGCNRFKHGNLLEYRLNLIKKIGLERVEWLDAHRTDVKKWQREELEEIIEKYKL